MSEQVDTPGSNADSSNNASKLAAPKDKACPFCHQPFTSSSLGRHLDLYIKDKNPKPSDGVHDVAEIRKLRGGITRRQPRNSLNRREGSTPGGTPAASGGENALRSPTLETGTQRLERQDAHSSPADSHIAEEPPKSRFTNFFDKPSWHATGVINDIPQLSNSGHSGHDEHGQGGRLAGHRVVSRQLAAKSTFEQKQKLAEAVDDARAAELALREIFGSLRAAAVRVIPNVTPFDYDPLSLDFPALTLHCLPPPPTLKSTSPIPSPKSWSIEPPDQQQYDALRAHFLAAFQSWRVSHAIVSDSPLDTLEYPPRQQVFLSDDDDKATMHAKVAELEEQVSSHLHATFSHWNTMTRSQRADLWRLEFARAVGSKCSVITGLESTCEKLLQENEHLRQQVEQLSRCQQPKEFQMMPPSTVTVDSRVLNILGERGLRAEGIGITIGDKDVPVHSQVKNAISRWKAVVKAARGAGNGMSAQRQLEIASGADRRTRVVNSGHMGSGQGSQDVDMDVDTDADADADGEVEADANAEAHSMHSGTSPATRPAPQAPMGMMSGFGNRGVVGDDGGRRADMPKMQEYVRL